LFVALFFMGLILAIAGMSTALKRISNDAALRPPRLWLVAVCGGAALLAIRGLFVAAPLVNWYVGKENIDSMHGVVVLLMALVGAWCVSLLATLALIKRIR